MKAVIVEDSRLARLELNEILKAYPYIEVVGEADNVAEGVRLISQFGPDIIFLDINLPDGTGFDLLEQVDSIHDVIFTTAYDEYAVKAFEVNALDYLLKPINPEHLARALNKLQGQTEDTREPRVLSEYNKIFVKDNDRCWLIELSQIRYFSSSGNHAQIFFDEHKPFIYKSLAKIEERLSQQVFFRANRQYIVNLNFINSVEAWGNSGLLLTMSDGKEIEVSRRHTTSFRQLLSL